MTYTDGFVIPLPKANVDAYREMASIAAEVWRDHGALDYKECIADDLDIEDMGNTFGKTLDLSEDETVVFAWITYESREDRDRINDAVMKDPRMTEYEGGELEMPFDTSRMLYGGFRVLVE